MSPTIALQSVDSGVAGDNITNVKVVSLTGVAETNSTVKLYDAAALIATVVAGTNGNWTFTTTALTDGVHNFTVTSTDAAGNVSAAAALNVTIDTVAPNAPVITGNTIVNSNQVALTGTAEAGSTVKLFDGTTVLATLTANASGAWSFTTGALPGGVHTFTAAAADKAGNTGVASQAVTSVTGATVIEANGATKLTAVGSNFFFYDAAGSGPSLKFGGVAVSAGQFGGWTPIGVEQTANGYQVAWKSGSDYTFWNTDSNGNYVSGLGVLSAISSTVTSAENAFHQDLNGDGVIGVQAVVNTGTVIEANGAAKLTAVGSNFFFYDAAGSGPSLKFGGVAVSAGQFGGWTPIGVEQTANGYQVAWKSGSDYTFWNTDSNGNYVSGLGVLSATSSTVTSAENAFHQDLNNDGTIGSAAPLAGNAMSGAAGTNTTTSIAANEIIHGNGGNDSFVFAANVVNNTLADVQPASDFIELNHNVSEDNAPAWIYAAQPGADGVLAADVTNSVTVSQVTLAELNHHGFHLV